jgi:glycine/D-amino acid oxidase-like deaminating enzyme
LDCHGTMDLYCWDGGKTWVIDAEPEGGAKATTAVAAGCRQPGWDLPEALDRRTANPPMRASDRDAIREARTRDREIGESGYQYSAPIDSTRARNGRSHSYLAAASQMRFGRPPLTRRRALVRRTEPLGNSNWASLVPLPSAVDCRPVWSEARGDYDRAISHFNQAIEAGCSSPEAYANRGLAWEKKSERSWFRAGRDKTRTHFF